MCLYLLLNNQRQSLFTTTMTTTTMTIPLFADLRLSLMWCHFVNPKKGSNNNNTKKSVTHKTRCIQKRWWNRLIIKTRAEIRPIFCSLNDFFIWRSSLSSSSFFASPIWFFSLVDLLLCICDFGWWYLNELISSMVRWHMQLFNHWLFYFFPIGVHI